MASTFNPDHPLPIVATQDGLVEETFAHSYDEKPHFKKEEEGQKGEDRETCKKGSIDRSSGEVEIVAVVDGDIIRESGEHSDYTEDLNTPFGFKCIATIMTARCRLYS